MCPIYVIMRAIVNVECVMGQRTYMYGIDGYVWSKEEAEAICREGRVFSKEDWPTLPHDIKEYECHKVHPYVKLKRSHTIEEAMDVDRS